MRSKRSDQKQDYNGSDELNERFHELFDAKLESNEMYYTLPDYIGSGSCRRIPIREGLQLHMNDICLKEHAQLEGRAVGSNFAMVYCLAEAMGWERLEQKSSYQLQRGEGLLYAVDGAVERGEYAAGQHYKGLSVFLGTELCRLWIEEYGLKPNVLQFFGQCSNEGGIKLPIETRNMAGQMLGCVYSGNLKSMYLEAKVMEMLAVCLHEWDVANSQSRALHGLTRSDMGSLQRAKELLDGSLADPPTLAKLARMVQLNEFKLKKGFKQLFGMPVYTYVLEGRMTLAQHLLGVERLRVGEVAERIGYSSSQHFTRAFNKRYGCTPSEYAKR